MKQGDPNPPLREQGPFRTEGELAVEFDMLSQGKFQKSLIEILVNDLVLKNRGDIALVTHEMVRQQFKLYEKLKLHFQSENRQ